VCRRTAIIRQYRRLNQGIDAMRRSGKLKAILKSYEWQAE
jgi:hypothetical protein